jgi:hypothetical protein
MSQCQVCGKPGEWVFDGNGNRLAIVCDNPPCQYNALKGFELDTPKQPKANEGDKPEQ